MIIAFSGKSSSGKTTSALYLGRTYGFHLGSFAATLKELAAKVFPFNYEELYGKKRNDTYKKYSWTPREVLVTLGHFCRFFDQDYFVSKLLDSIKQDGYKNYVIDDLRFKNEAEALKNEGAVLIRIERYAKHLTTSNDQSETDLDDYKGWDYKINEVENSSLNLLYQSLENIMEDLELHGKH